MHTCVHSVREGRWAVPLRCTKRKCLISVPNVCLGLCGPPSPTRLARPSECRASAGPGAFAAAAGVSVLPSAGIQPRGAEARAAPGAPPELVGAHICCRGCRPGPFRLPRAERASPRSEQDRCGEEPAGVPAGGASATPLGAQASTLTRAVSVHIRRLPPAEHTGASRVSGGWYVCVSCVPPRTRRGRSSTAPCSWGHRRGTSPGVGLCGSRWAERGVLGRTCGGFAGLMPDPRRPGAREPARYSVCASSAALSRGEVTLHVSSVSETSYVSSALPARAYFYLSDPVKNISSM